MLGRLAPIGRYQVEGESMSPALAPGERVLVNRAAYWFGAPRTGDVVVVRDPREPARLLVKRIDAADEEGYRVLGDHSEASTDSRTFGPVRREQILGKVWLRY